MVEHASQIDAAIRLRLEATALAQDGCAAKALKRQLEAVKLVHRHLCNLVSSSPNPDRSTCIDSNQSLIAKSLLAEILAEAAELQQRLGNSTEADCLKSRAEFVQASNPESLARTGRPNDAVALARKLWWQALMLPTAKLSKRLTQAKKLRKASGYFAGYLRQGKLSKAEISEYYILQANIDRCCGEENAELAYTAVSEFRQIADKGENLVSQSRLTKLLTVETLLKKKVALTDKSNETVLLWVLIAGTAAALILGVSTKSLFADYFEENSFSRVFVLQGIMAPLMLAGACFVNTPWKLFKFFSAGAAISCSFHTVEYCSGNTASEIWGYQIIFHLSMLAGAKLLESARGLRFRARVAQKTIEIAENADLTNKFYRWCPSVLRWLFFKWENDSATNFRWWFASLVAHFAVAHEQASELIDMLRLLIISIEVVASLTFPQEAASRHRQRDGRSLFLPGSGLRIFCALYPRPPHVACL